MKDLQREILNQVAAGKITAEEAAARLDSLVADAPGGATAASGTTGAAALVTASSATRLVKVVSQFGTAEIVGDPSVAFAVAEGQHTARQDGDSLVIEHVPFEREQSFSFGDGGRRFVVDGLDFHRRRSMTVRMNPDLPLFASVQAGNVRVEGVHGPISSEVQAGNCSVIDFRSPIDLVVQAGNVTASGRLESGASKVRCEMGSVKINLEKGSSVKITARTTLGKIAVEGESGEHVVVGRSGKEVTVGSGAGTLDIECTMGNVRVSAE